MLKRALPFVVSLFVAACSGMAPSGGPTGGGGSLDAAAIPAPAGAPTAAQPVSGDGDGQGTYAYSQISPGFPAGNPGPDVTPEDKKFQFYIFPKLVEYEEEVLAGPIEAKLRGLRVSGTLQCQASAHATLPCQEGLILRTIDLKRMKFVETKIEVAEGGRYAFHTEFPGSAQPEGPTNFEYWAFYLNYNPDYAPRGLPSLQDCPAPGTGAANFVCLPASRGPFTWGYGMPFESLEKTQDLKVFPLIIPEK